MIENFPKLVHFYMVVNRRFLHIITIQTFNYLNNDSRLAEDAWWAIASGVVPVLLFPALNSSLQVAKPMFTNSLPALIK